MPFSTQIELRPHANEKIAAKVLEHARDLRGTDPGQSMELHEKVIRLGALQIKDCNKKIRALNKILLTALSQGEGD